MRNFKKLISVILAVMMVMSVMPVSAIESAGGAGSGSTLSLDPEGSNSIIFNEDFEDYETDVNWTQNLDGDKFVTGLGLGKETAWTIYGNNGYNENDNTVVQVIDGHGLGTKGTGDQVLKIEATNNNGQRPFIQVRANANGATGIARADMPEGKKLVYSADIYLPYSYSSYKANEEKTAPILAYSTNSLTPSNMEDNLAFKTGAYAGYGYYAIINSQQGAYGFSQSMERLATTGTERWTTIKRILDVSALPSADHPVDTMRYIHDGHVVSIKVRDNISRPANFPAKLNGAKGTEIIDTWAYNVDANGRIEAPDFFGAAFGGRDNGDNNNHTYYVDNVKAYWIDAFKQQGEVTYGKTDIEGRWAAGAIEIPFNNEIAETVKSNSMQSLSNLIAGPDSFPKTKKEWTLPELVYLLDASGNVVTGGVTNAYLKEGASNVLVVEVKEGLTVGDSYTIAVDAHFSDTEYQGLAVTSDVSEKIEVATVEIGIPYVEFKATSITPAQIENFTQGADTTATAEFTLEVSDDAITNGIVVTNIETGETVARDNGWTATIGADDKTVTFDFTNLPTADYTVTTAPGFAATNGEPFAGRFEITITAVEFKATSINPAQIKNFAQGADATATAEFTLEVDDAAITNGIVVTNIETGETVERNDGWTATIGADNKTVTFDFTNLPTADYTVTTAAAFAATNGVHFEGQFEITITALKTVLFNEDFEDYETEVNWTQNLDDNKFVTGLGARKETTWSIYGNNNYDKDNNTLVEVIPSEGLGGKDADDQVLKISSENTSWIQVRANADGTTGIARADMPEGKKLVYSADIYLPTTFNIYDLQAPLLGYSTGTPSAKLSDKVAFNTDSYAGGGMYPIVNSQSGAYGFGKALVRLATTTDNTIPPKWTTIKRILDVSAQPSEDHPVDTMRFIHDGAVMTIKVRDQKTKPANFNDKLNGDAGTVIIDTWQNDFDANKYSKAPTFYGAVFGDQKGNSGQTADATIYYIDNVKAYWIDAFKQDGVIDYGDVDGNGHYYSGPITIPFNNQIAETVYSNEMETPSNLQGTPVKNPITEWKLIDLVYLLDENGNEVAGGITSVTLSADKKSLVVVPTSQLTEGKEYTIAVNSRFSDTEYQGLAVTGEASEKIEVTTFTTAQRLAIESISPAAVTDYDLGQDKVITIKFAEPLAVDETDLKEAFTVTDKDGNGENKEGLDVSFGDTKDIVKLQLSGLQLGDGKHLIQSVNGKLANADGIFAIVSIAVDTVDFNVTRANPTSESITEYVEGTDKVITLTLSTRTNLAADKIATGFEVVDKNGDTVNGLTAKLLSDKKTIELYLLGLDIGVGQHTIKSKPALVDERGRQLELDYKFNVLPFTASYDKEVTGYEPGTEKTVEISLSYPLNDATISNLDNSFVVKNEAELKVTGLKATVSEDKKVIKLALKDLDITGGTYNITSKSDAIVDVKGEALAENIDFKLITTSAGGLNEAPSGEAAGSGSDLTEIPGNPVNDVFSNEPLLYEDFDSYRDIANEDWISNRAVIPNNFKLSVKGERFSDASVSIVEDPANPGSGNMVLKNVSGYYGMTGNVLAQAVSNPANYHVVQRNLDDGSKETIPTDGHTIVRVKTKLYIPRESMPQVPSTADQTRYANYLLGAVGGSDYVPITTSVTFSNESGGPSLYSVVTPANFVDPSVSKNQIFKQVFTTDVWHTLEFIFGVNPKTDGTTFESCEILINGKSVGTELGKYFAASYSTIGGMISQIVSTSSAKGPITVYYDDWSITQETRFTTHVNVPLADVPENQVIKLTLTKDLDSASMQLIKDQNLVTLTDEKGNNVDATVTYSDNNRIVVTPTYGLKYKTKYVVKIGTEAIVNGFKQTVKAADGTLFGGLTYTFETAKALSTHVEFDADDFSCNHEYLEDATSFTYNMQLSEPAPTDIIAAVATFDGKDELLNIEYEIISQGQQTKNFTLTSPTGTKSFRIYIWEQNGDGSMGRLMQLPDEITSR